jgi:50S ribosomal subunit-associated GTPase HflX
VYNKTDMIQEEFRNKDDSPSAVYVSALEGNGISRLKQEVERFMDKDTSVVTVKVPQSRQDIINALYEYSYVYGRDYKDNDVIFQCSMTEELVTIFKEFIID